MNIVNIYLGIIAAYCLLSSLYHLLDLFGFSLKIERRKAKSPDPTPPAATPISGTSNYTMRHPTPPRDTARHTVETPKNGRTFASESEKQNQMEIDLDSEADDENPEPTAPHSGVELPEIRQAITTLQNPNSSVRELRLAGEIFSRLEGSELLEQLTNDDETRRRIAQMLDRHEQSIDEPRQTRGVELPTKADIFNIDDYI